MTAYAVPPRWEHGDFVGATDMAKYSTGQTALYERLGATVRTPCIQIIAEKGHNATPWEDSVIYFTHRKRFLIFRSSGLLHDPAGLEDDISLADEDTYTTYDLETVSWLTYGTQYYVSGVDFAWECDVPTQT